ncbi:MAG TPA: hypothetical protein PKZ83_17255 [bacterium]|nr:hypothetical protein [bacterium]HQJ66315.1 hypothetical protein [bacterium]
MADVPFEIKFNNTDWATFGFRLVKDGVQGLDEMRPSRMDIEWIPGRDQPYYFGAFLGEKRLTVTGVVTADDRSDLRDLLLLLKANLATSLGEAKHLVFGDSAAYYQAIYDGTFIVQFLGSTLTGNAALVTVGFLIIADRWIT